MDDLTHMVEEIRNGNRRALSKAITLVESSHVESRLKADLLVDKLSTHKIRQSLRIGMTGAPGVGKSTLINALGTELVSQKHRIAVLAVDPSSSRRGGSILGDKTRMETLSREPLAYIRPSPSNNVLGGVAKFTREVIFLCEQAGFDAVLVETTGVGQSEITVAELTDIFVLLVAPAGGDELQGIKRGIMELADFVVITKSDGELLPIAERTCAEYLNAMRLFARRHSDPDNNPMALTVSAHSADQINQLWKFMVELADWRKLKGIWNQNRIQQDINWVREHLHNRIVEAVESKINLSASLHILEQDILTSGTVFSLNVRNQLQSVVESIFESPR